MDPFQTVGAPQSADSSNTTANYIEGGIHKLAEKSHSSRFLHSSLLFLPVAQDEEYAHVHSQIFMCMQIPLGHKGQSSLAQQVARGRFELPSAGDSYPIL